MSDAKDNRFYREPQPSSKELVKSLRDYSEGPTFYWGPICQKAAEEIERLQRELAASAAQYQEACDDANRFARERDEARASPEPSVLNRRARIASRLAIALSGTSLAAQRERVSSRLSANRATSSRTRLRVNHRNPVSLRSKAIYDQLQRRKTSVRAAVDLAK
jgi:hypothetical protein